MSRLSRATFSLPSYATDMQNTYTMFINSSQKKLKYSSYHVPLKEAPNVKNLLSLKKCDNTPI